MFEAPTDLYTEEGTLLYKAGAQFRAKVHRTKNRLWTNKQNKALFIFDYANYPNNTEKKWLLCHTQQIRSCSICNRC